MNEGFEFTLHALKITGAWFRFALGLLDRARERTPEKVASPGVRWSHGAQRRAGRGRQEEEEGERGELGFRARRSRSRCTGRGGGLAGKGERGNKGYAKLPFCPSLISFIYATVQT